MKEVKDLQNAKYTFDSDTIEECEDEGYYSCYSFDCDGINHEIFEECFDHGTETIRGYNITSTNNDGTETVVLYDLVKYGSATYRVDPKTNRITTLSDEAALAKDNENYINELLHLLEGALRVRYPEKSMKYSIDNKGDLRLVVSKLLSDYANDIKEVK